MALRKRKLSSYDNGSGLPPPPPFQFKPCQDPLRHQAKNGSHATPKYGLLFSAAAGCLDCVRYWHEEMGVSLDVTSDNHSDWDTRYYASHNGKSEIVAYIDSKMRERTNSVVECRGLHTKSGCELDQLIAAAEVGCSKCCYFLVQECGVSVHTQGAGVWCISALEAAEAGAAKRRPGCAEVVKFMRAQDLLATG